MPIGGIQPSLKRPIAVKNWASSKKCEALTEKCSFPRLQHRKDEGAIEPHLPPPKERRDRRVGFAIGLRVEGRLPLFCLYLCSGHSGYVERKARVQTVYGHFSAKVVVVVDVEGEVR